MIKIDHTWHSNQITWSELTVTLTTLAVNNSTHIWSVFLPWGNCSWSLRQSWPLRRTQIPQTRSLYSGLSANINPTNISSELQPFKKHKAATTFRVFIHLLNVGTWVSSRNYRAGDKLNGPPFCGHNYLTHRNTSAAGNFQIVPFNIITEHNFTQCIYSERGKKTTCTFILLESLKRRTSPNWEK